MLGNKNDDDDVTKELPKVRLPEFFEMIDKNKKQFIDVLKAAVAIPSTSHKSESFPDVFKMINWCKKELEDLGLVVEIVENRALSADGKILPPVILASLFVDDQLKNICVYGHLDTKPASKADGWETDPFELAEKNGRLYGRGASDNKGPLMCWFSALKIYRTTRTDLPVNIKFVIDGTSELQSPGLEDILWRKQGFFSDVQYVCCTIDKKFQDRPCLIYGYRGVCHFSFDVNCGNEMVDSGTFGGTLNQPLIDATNVIGSLIDKHGKIAVSEVLKDVAPISIEEEKLCKDIAFDLKKLKTRTGAKWLQHKEDNIRLIMHKTRLPSITVHSIDHELDSDDKRAYMDSVPNRAVAKFSIRIVPNQTPPEVYRHLDNYIKKIWNRYKSVNQYSFKMDLGMDPWRDDPFNAHYRGTATSIESLHHVKPAYYCQGSTVPAVTILQFICTGSSILVLPIRYHTNFNLPFIVRECARKHRNLTQSEENSTQHNKRTMNHEFFSGHDDMPHSNSESISEENYINGIKMVMSYMCHVYETK